MDGPVQVVTRSMDRLGYGLDRLAARPGWELPTYLIALALCFALGLTLLFGSTLLMVQWVGRGFLALGAAGVFMGLIEMVVLRALGLFPLGALVRVTYYEALLQPFTVIVLAAGWLLIMAGSFIPFFTLGEDTKMYRDVATQFVLMFPMVIMVFAAGKVIDEEIENRTMLTLLSKPIARWQVIVGKYLGVVCLALVAIVVLGIAAMMFSYVRFMDDMRIDLMVARQGGAKELNAMLATNTKAVIAMVPLMTLQFLQVATLAAISVAISTRWGLALNMTIVALLYVGANLAPGLHGAGFESHVQWLLEHAAYMLPYLSNFDLSPLLIYGRYSYQNDVPDVTTLAQVWQYVGLAAVYALMYIGAALSVAVALFRTRELT